MYLVAEQDWSSGRALSFRGSNTLDAGFCVERPPKPLAPYGRLKMGPCESNYRYASAIRWRERARRLRSLIPESCDDWPQSLAIIEPRVLRSLTIKRHVYVLPDAGGLLRTGPVAWNRTHVTLHGEAMSVPSRERRTCRHCRVRPSQHLQFAWVSFTCGGGHYTGRLRHARPQKGDG